MSYGRGDLTSGSGGYSDNFNSYQNNGSSPNADYSRLTQQIGSVIQKITQNVREIKQMVNMLGTRQDTPDLREMLHQRQHYTNNLAKDVSKHFKEVKALHSSGPPSEQRHRKTQTDKLMADFSDVLNSFQAVQRESAQAEKECVARARAASSAQNEQGSDVLINLQGSIQDVQQTTVTVEELEEIKEREDAIRQLEADILDVNMIFKDLGTMVHEQGEMIDSIEANVEHAEDHVTQGNVQLKQARASQTSARKKKFICAALVLVIIVILIIIIVFSVKGKN